MITYNPVSRILIQFWKQLVENEVYSKHLLSFWLFFFEISLKYGYVSTSWPYHLQYVSAWRFLVEAVNNKLGFAVIANMNVVHAGTLEASNNIVEQLSI